MAEQDYFSRNQAYVAPGEHTYNTALPDQQEVKFRSWVKGNNVPFDPDQKNADYDMRGFYVAAQAGDPRTVTSINPNDRKPHYDDYWKTPYHKSFSAESQWADPAKAPKWNETDQLVTPDGTVIFGEREEARLQAEAKKQDNRNVVKSLREKDAK
jgi:hypothetical protein